MEQITHIVLHSLEHIVTIIPFLFIVFLILEYLEHTLSGKTVTIIEKSGKSGPLWGGILGLFPQCGFSVAATNLFAGRVITLGTLIAVYLSTSDEMLPILISGGVNSKSIFAILAFKLAIGAVAGFIIDMIFKQSLNKEHIHDMCSHTNCGCGKKSIFLSALHHTLEITVILTVTTIILNFIIEYVGEDTLKAAVQSAGVFAPLASSLIGLIPNCASSVVITQLYVANAISAGTLISGLLTGCGLGWIVLFKVNQNKKENFKILAIVYAVGALSGIFIDLFKITF